MTIIWYFSSNYISSYKFLSKNNKNQKVNDIKLRYSNKIITIRYLYDNLKDLINSY